MVLADTYDRGAFAPTADTVVETLRARGLDVEYGPGDPGFVSLRESADWWGPTLLVLAETLRLGGIELFVAALMDDVRERGLDPANTVAHCRLGQRITTDEEVRWMDYDGPADALPDAIHSWWSGQR
jgi:hypothetical protein